MGLKAAGGAADAGGRIAWPLGPGRLFAVSLRLMCFTCMQGHALGALGHAGPGGYILGPDAPSAPLAPLLFQARPLGDLRCVLAW